MTIFNWVKLQIVHSEIAVSQQNVKEANVTLIHHWLGRNTLESRAEQCPERVGKNAQQTWPHDPAPRGAPTLPVHYPTD